MNLGPSDAGEIWELRSVGHIYRWTLVLSSRGDSVCHVGDTFYSSSPRLMSQAGAILRGDLILLCLLKGVNWGSSASIQTERALETGSLGVYSITVWAGAPQSQPLRDHCRGAAGRRLTVDLKCSHHEKETGLLYGWPLQGWRYNVGYNDRG